MKRPEIKLRGHHLICLHFFKGEGYNPQFVRNLVKILRRVESGETIRVYPGADDVCKICPYLKNEECFYDNDAETEIRKMDMTALELVRLTVMENVLWSDISKEIPRIFHGWLEKFCMECDWKWACEKDARFKKLSHEGT